MNENLNLVEILKHAPKGTKLWSPIFGECIFQYIYINKGEDWEIPMIHTITTKDYCSKDSIIYWADFLSNGKLESCYGDDGECMLFPSKENRDWSKLKTLWMHKHFELGQKVLVPYHDGDIYKWRLTFYSHYDEDIKQHFTTDAMGFLDEEVIAYKGNEDKLGKAVE